MTVSLKDPSLFRQAAFIGGEWIEADPKNAIEVNNPATGEIIPLHFIQRVLATHNGKTVLDAQWSQAVSKNPFLHFRVKGARAGDRITVGWEDNKGEKASIDATLA